MARSPGSIRPASRRACAGRSTATLPGQAQKEASVNGAHVRVDMLLHPAVEGAASEPPAGPGEGLCWLVGPSPTGEFSGKEECLASAQGAGWVFAAPRDGMRVFDRATGQFLLYAGGWRREVAPAEPVGGSVIDQEARAAIAALIDLLRKTAVLSAE